MSTVQTILADDHEVVRSGIRNALTSIDVLEIVGEVANGPDLLSILARAHPELLLLDITMPDFDPISQIRRIRYDYPDMKILVISAYDDDVYVQGLLGVGVDGYHLKDQPLSDLRLAVERVLAGEKWVSSKLVHKLIGLNHEASAEGRESQPRGDQSGSPQTVQLTTRQAEIMELLQEGLDNNSIARRMNLSIKTIENHLTRLYRQLNVQSRMEAVNYMRQYSQTKEQDALALGPSGYHVQNQQLDIDAELLLPVEGQILVLLVDDNARYRHQLRRMVGKACDYARIYDADSVEDAVEITQEVMPELVLIDVVLGDEDGIQCARQIKLVSPRSRLVLITAYPDREFHRRGLEAGAVALLDKKVLDTSAVRQVIADTI